LVIFVLGYTLIALEHRFQINKTATAIFLAVTLWVLYMLGADQFVPQNNAVAFQQYLTDHTELQSAPLLEQVRGYVVDVSVIEHLGDISEIIFFLMGAMTIVELVDKNGGFNFVNRSIRTRKSIKLLWIMSFMTFFLSAVLDNMTTAIVMIMVLRKLVSTQKERWTFAGMIILAANAGGAFSPIGDVTTIMLWIGGNISSMHTIGNLFLPSLISMVVPLIILSFSLRGTHVEPTNEGSEEDVLTLATTKKERLVIFVLGVGGLMAVPLFRSVTGLPPFMGILGVLSVLWLYTEVIYGRIRCIEDDERYRVSKVLKNVDMSTILFFLGILMAVAALQEV
ncbi:MAG: sodium:proton antiporter NhaD, partial [Rikenellaceae bacterium]